MRAKQGCATLMKYFSTVITLTFVSLTDFNRKQLKMAKAIFGVLVLCWSLTNVNCQSCNEAMTALGDCDNQLTDGNDDVCSGTCRTLHLAYFEACSAVSCLSINYDFMFT